MAVHMGTRFTTPGKARACVCVCLCVCHSPLTFVDHTDVAEALGALVLARTSEAVAIPEALKYLLTEHNVQKGASPFVCVLKLCVLCF